jgi:hypothetical protein
VAFIKEGAYKLRLQEGFSTGSRHTTSGCLVKHVITTYNIENFLDAHRLAIEDECFVSAG